MRFHLAPAKAPAPPGLDGLVFLLIGLSASESIGTRVSPSRHSRPPRAEGAPTLGTVPAAPNGLMATAVSSSAIRLSWTDTGRRVVLQGGARVFPDGLLGPDRDHRDERFQLPEHRLDGLDDLPLSGARVECGRELGLFQHGQREDVRCLAACAEQPHGHYGLVEPDQLDLDGQLKQRDRVQGGARPILHRGVDPDR